MGKAPRVGKRGGPSRPPSPLGRRPPSALGLGVGPSLGPAIGLLPPSWRRGKGCPALPLPLRLSLFLLVRAPQFGASTEEEEASQAARRRAAGSPSPSHLFPQLHWIGEEEEVVFHRTCAKPSRYCMCGTCCRTVFINIKFVAVRDRRDLEVAS